TLRSCHSNEESVAEIDIWRSFSSASASDTVVPSSTVPSRLVAPAWNSRASCSEVLPLPRWPTRATLRIRSEALCIPLSSPRCRGENLPLRRVIASGLGSRPGHGRDRDAERPFLQLTPGAHAAAADDTAAS